MRNILTRFVVLTLVAACSDDTGRTGADSDVDGGSADLEVDLDAADASDADLVDEPVEDVSPDVASDVSVDSADAAQADADAQVTPACEASPVPVVAAPGLLWDGDVPALLARIEDPPFDAVWTALQARARATIPEGLTAPELYVRGNIAKAAALVGLVEDDQALLERARDLVAALPQTMNGVLLRGADDDIHVADGLVGHAVALHLLQSSDLDVAQAESALAGLARAFFAYFSFYDLWWGYIANNHTTKSAAALGLTALVVPGDEDAATWLRYASAQMAYLYREWLISADGAYAEGPGYNTYASITTTPFVIALHRALAGDEGLCGLAICAFRQYDTSCVDGPEWAPDLLDTSFFRANLDWTVAFLRPDGTLPPYDDSNAGGYPAGALAGPAGHAGSAWMFERWGPVMSTTDLRVETLLTWDDDLEPAHPEALEMWLPEAGTAMRRSGWGPDDRYVFLLAEPSAMQGSGHEQADGLSLTIFDRGAPRLIDSGYSKFTDRDFVSHAEQHNTVFIDGLGPPLPATLARDNLPAYLRERAADRWTAEMTLAGGQITRTVVFLENGTLEVTDRATFSEAGPHRLAARWHSLGGLTPEEDDRGVFKPTERGGRWTAGGVVTQVDAPGASATHELQHDGLRYGDLRQHRCVIVEVEGEGEAELITRIWIGDEGSAPPWE